CSGGESSIGINSNPAFAHTGSFSADPHYRISTPGFFTSDMRFGYSNPPQTHIYVSGWVYFHNTGTDLSTVGPEGIGRKLIYIKSNKSDGGQTYFWILSTRSYDSSVGPLDVYICADSSTSTGCFVDFLPNRLNWETWYQIEFELQESTPGQSDGFYNLYL